MAHLKAIAREQNITFRQADILVVRTGFVAAYSALADDAKKAISKREGGDAIGVEASRELLEWLWENQFAALVSDALSWEASPPQAAATDVCVHHLLSKCMEDVFLCIPRVQWHRYHFSLVSELLEPASLLIRSPTPPYSRSCFSYMLTGSLQGVCRSGSSLISSSCRGTVRKLSEPRSSSAASH